MSICKKIVHQERGQAVIVISVAFAFLAMLVGLAVDAGRAYVIKSRLERVADSAAVIGARHWRDSDHTLGVAAACDAARLNSMTVDGPAGTCPAGINVGVEDLTSPDGSVATGVVVTASTTMRTTLLRLGTLLGCGDACRQATISVRAAALATPPPCVFVTNPTEDDALEILGTADVSVPQCGVYVGSNAPTAVNMNGGATMVASSVDIVGGTNSPGAITPAPRLGVRSRGDPLGRLPEPSPPAGSCTPQPAGANKSFTPGYYCNINLTHGTHTFAPGEYYIENGFRVIGSASVSGDGVFFHIANGAVKIAGTGSVDFTAPTSGRYSGLTFFQARSNTTQAEITGDQALHVEGLYFPSAALDLSGGSCTEPLKGIIVADTARIVGSTCIDKPDGLPGEIRNQAVLVY